MALDPSIPLQIRPPVIPQIQIQTPVDQLAKVLSLRELMQKGQMSGIQLEEAQNELNDQNVLRQRFPALLQQYNGDFEKALQDPSLASGITPKTLLNLNTMSLGLKEKGAQISKANADASEANSKVAQAETNYIGHLARGIQQANYSPAALDAALAHAEQLNPAYKEQIEIIRQNAAANPDSIKAMIDQLVTQSPEASTQAREEATALGVQREAAARLPGIVVDTAQKVKMQDAQILAPAAAQGSAALAAALAKLPPDRQAPFLTAKTPKDILTVATTPAEQITAGQAATTAAETARHNLSAESNAKLNTAISQGRLDQEKLINGIKYGPGTTEYWVSALRDNPDLIKELPPELRSSVGQGFLRTTGLPLPTTLDATTKTQETSARNALDSVQYMRTAMQNPEVAKQLGKIMGRLGNVEQKVGTAVGLSPEATQLAQELRSRMRMFIFQEGKTFMQGGRVSPSLIEALESSVPNPKMDPDILTGALNAAEGNAQTVLDNVDRERFGGNMRPREMRSGPGVGRPAPGTAPPGSEKAFEVQNPGDTPKPVWIGPDGQRYYVAPSGGATAPATKGLTGPEPRIIPAPRSYMKTYTNAQGHKIGTNDDINFFDVVTGQPIRR
jgi:hypothetical protein